MRTGADVAGNGDNAMGDGTAQAGAADPYDIGAGVQIGQETDSEHDELTDAFEKLAATPDTVVGTDWGRPSDPEEASHGMDPMNADHFADLTDGPEPSYQSDPLSDIHSGPWNQGLPDDVGGPQPPDQGGVGGSHPSPGGLGGPHPDQGPIDPAGPDSLDNTGVLDLN